MPVHYRETVVDRSPAFDPRGTVPRQTQQPQQQRLLLQPQFSAGSSVTGTTIVSPSESTYIFGANDPRSTQSEGDGSEFGTWLSASHLGTPQQTAKVPPPQPPFVASPQRMPSVTLRNELQHQPQSQMPHFPLEVCVRHGGDAKQSQEGGEVSRRSERWSREEFYPPTAANGRMPGAPFHKVTKEDYVIEQVVETSPKLANVTRIVYPAQQQPLGGQMPTQQQNQPKEQQQQQHAKQEQLQRQTQPQQTQRQQPPQVPMKTPQQQRTAQSTQPQHQLPMQQQLQQPQRQQQQQQPHYEPLQPLHQGQPAEHLQKTQNYAQQHQFVQQQVHFQQPQHQHQHEQPQHATQREQPQNGQYEMKQPQQPTTQRVQIVEQKTQLGQMEQQKQQQQKQAVVGEQQQQQPQKWVPYQQQQQQIDKYAWEDEATEEKAKLKQQQRTAQMPRTEAETEEGTEDEPPPQMQLAEAPEELIQRQKSAGEGGDGSVSPERQTHRRHVMVNSPWYRQHPDFEPQKYQDFRNYAEPLYVCSDFTADGSAYPSDDSRQKSPQKYHYQHFQPQQRVHHYFSPSSVKWDSVYEDEFPDGQAPPFAHGPGSPYDYLLYHQKVNLDRRRAESEQRRRHHSPVPGAAEHGYKFGGMDFVDHDGFNPCSDVGEPFDERQSRRDLHTGPPRRRGDFYGLDYTTMLPDGQLQPPNEWAAEDAQNYHGYQPLPPRKNFRLCGRYTADPDAPLNITEAEGLDELDSEYLVGNTLSNQRCVADRELTDDEKRTFALLYGPGGFKPDHVTVRPDPVPDEPPVFSTTIGPQKSRSAADISPTPQGYVNPMKVEGESWMLGRRSEQGNYGLASSGEQPPFVRPARFPPHVPQWAKDRQFSMTRGAKSIDRSLFAPSWAKVPQPQPPYWVKRTEGGKGVGAGQKGKAEEKKENGAEMGEEQRIEAVQTHHHQKQQQMEQQKEQQQTKQKQQQHNQQTQGQRIGQTENLMAKQKHEQQQLRAVQPQNAQQPPFEMGMQKTTVVTTVEITEEHQANNQPQEEQQTQQQQRVGAVQQMNGQRQWNFGHPQLMKQPQQQRNQIAMTNTKTTKTTTAENEANGTQKVGQTQQWHHQQQQQQPTGQVQAVQQQMDKVPAQQKPFTQPGGMYYFHEKRTEDKGTAKEEEKQPQMVPTDQRRIVTKQQQQTEESSGLENLKMPKLGDLPLPEGGKRFTGPTEQQMVRNRNPQQQQQTKEGQQQTVRQQMPKFPTGRRWSQEPQEGDIFVDGHGRPVHYVREMVVDPRTGETVTREEWRLADEQRPEAEEAGEGQRQNGNMLPVNSSRHFRQQTITKNAVKQ